MRLSDCLFWNVDTQIDFVSPKGKLYVPGAELLKTKWKYITDLAKQKNIQVINTADYHTPASDELSLTPDFITKFPEHCMANSKGAEYIEETNPENPLILNWDNPILLTTEMLKSRNIVIRKDAFDVFSGNPQTGMLVNLISPKIVVVYGVTTNVCVNDAVLGLVKRVGEVVVVEDAIKELPEIPLPFENWKKKGVKLLSIHQLEKRLNSWR